MRNPLPIHPRLRHPLTGEPLQAVGVVAGKVIWPHLGAAPDPDPDPAPDPQPNPPDKPNRGFPEDTPVAEMSTEQQAAYWKHQSRRHEDHNRQLRGDRTPDQVKADLAELDRLRKEQQTPSEQAIEQARTEGRTAATTEANRRAVTAILTASLQARGKTEDQITSLIATCNPDAFIADGDIATDKVTSYVNTVAGPIDDKKWPDMGGGNRDRSKTESSVSAGRQRYRDRHPQKTA